MAGVSPSETPHRRLIKVPTPSLPASASSMAAFSERREGRRAVAICLSASRFVEGASGSSMPIEIGQVEAIFRYPVKSMGGERLEAARLGWHGLDGDRRLAFRRIDDRSGFPWLTASKLPDLLLFAPHRREDGAQGDLPTHVRTPDGEELPVFGEELAAEVGRRYGAPVQMMQLKHGIFDEASISVIASDTVREIGRLAGRSLDVRRFRPNVVVRLLRPVPFQEDEWVGGVLSFGEGDDAPAITVTMRDVRCSMVNLDPDSASPAPEVLKAVVRANQNNAGIYGAVTRIGRLAVGQTDIPPYGRREDSASPRPTRRRDPLGGADGWERPPLAASRSWKRIPPSLPSPVWCVRRIDT